MEHKYLTTESLEYNNYIYVKSIICICLWTVYA